MTMVSEYEQDVHAILSEFEGTWNFDVRDLSQPSGDQVLKKLIAKKDPARQARLTDEFFACGPLDSLIMDLDVQEIIVNGAKDIWFERAGCWQALPDGFLSESTFFGFIDRLCRESQIKNDLAQPFGDGRWRGFRVHIARAPLSHCAFHVTLRRLSENFWTLERLQSQGWCESPQLELIRRLIHEQKNTLVIGPTGSGKTSVLGACLKELADNERVVILEDTDELPRPNSASTKLLTRPESAPGLPAISLADLVKQSLRMRPLRLVVGEVRGGEAKDLLLALATGHIGSWGTLHASDARQALLRLEMLIQIGAPQWSLTTVRQLLHLSVDALVVCGMKNGHRRLEGVYRVAALESVGLLLEPLYARTSM